MIATIFTSRAVAVRPPATKASYSMSDAVTPAAIIGQAVILVGT